MERYIEASKKHINKAEASFVIDQVAGGDAGIIKINIEKRVGPGWFSSDIKQAQFTIEKIILFLKKYPAVKYYCGHK